jgi:enolase-phosphatase E1
MAVSAMRRVHLPTHVSFLSYRCGSILQRVSNHRFTFLSVTNGDLGHLWKTGFAEGHLKTPLFDDVVPTLEAWKKAGKKLAIFSSGSVQAQLQFFSYVKDGETTRDIKPLFSAHYDTVNAGPKMEKASYQKICSELGCDVSKVTFLTDNVKEAEAAMEANVQSVVVDRPGNAPLSEESRAKYPVIQQLTDLP